MLVLIALALSACVPQSAQPSKPVPPGPAAAPTFQLEDLRGEKWSLEDLRGEVTVLYFWMTGCPACIAKLPELAELQKNLPVDVNLLLINHGDAVKSVREKVGKFPGLNVLLDGQDVFSLYGIRSVPTTVFITKDGRISQGYIGLLPNKEILKIVSELR